MSEKEKSFCWSCGKPLGSCICDNASQPITVITPEQTLPFCGVSKDGEDFERFLVDVPMMRPCCMCHEEFMTQNIRDWLHGICPNCGANGLDGDGKRHLELEVKPFKNDFFLKGEKITKIEGEQPTILQPLKTNDKPVAVPLFGKLNLK